MIQMNSNLLNEKYNSKRRTMYIAMPAFGASNTISPIIKQRGLLLRN